jgi:hypothetical protein
MRPRAFNNKGIFDEYRRPKRAVEKIRGLMKADSEKQPINPKEIIL